jgi:hypothetical protein
MYNSSIKVTKLLLLAISIVTTLTIILPANIIGQVWAEVKSGQIILEGRMEMILAKKKMNNT